MDRLLHLACYATADDAELLHRFVADRDESAFAELVRRHGPLVLGVCRRALGDSHDAEDAFQATFALLAGRAARLTQPGSLAGWLHAAALRITRQARRTAARRRRREQAAAPTPAADDLTWRELREWLDAEIARLPESYRLPLILCYLEGLPIADAAQRAGCSPTVFRGRLERGRLKLRQRLERLGLPLAATLAVTTEAVSATLRQAACDAATGVRVSPAVAVLLAGGTTTGGLKLAAAAALLLTAVALGASGNADPPAKQPPPSPAPRPATDQHADPLPPYAVARLGAYRFDHGESIHEIVFAPDGKTVVTRGQKGNKLWDAVTGREIPLADAVKNVQVFAGGNRLVGVQTAADGSGVDLLDLTTANQVGRLKGASTRWISTLTPDSSALISFAWLENAETKIRTARLFFGNVATSQFEVPDPPLGNVAAPTLTLSANGQALVVFDRDRTLQIWDVVQRKRRAIAPEEVSRSRAVAISPAGDAVAVVPRDSKGVRLYDTATFRELPALADVFDDGVTAVAFSPDGKTLAVGSIFKGVGLWDLATRKKLRDIAAEDCFVLSRLTFSPDGKTLACAIGYSLVLFDVATGQPRPDYGQAFAMSIGFTPDGRSLVAGRGISGNTVRMWDLATGRETRRWQAGPEEVGGIAIPAKGDWFATQAVHGPVRVWDAGTGRERFTIDAGKCTAVAASPDGTLLATSSRQKPFALWDPRTGKEVRTVGTTDRSIGLLAFLPDGQRLVAIPSNDGPMQLRDVADGKLIREIGPASEKWSCVAVSPDGRAIARPGDDGAIRLFDPDTGKELRSFGQVPDGDRPAEVRGVAFSPDGRLIAGAYSDRVVRVFETATGREAATYPGHRGAILAVAFSPDGRQLASSSADRTILVWDVIARARK